MIAQAGVRPGMSVLEIGSGLQRGAARRGHRQEGRVVTVDIDPEITGRAEAALDHRFRSFASGWMSLTAMLVMRTPQSSRSALATTERRAARPRLRSSSDQRIGVTA
jgi:hypothetical protein